ncbi:MAG: T9SS type A sorting domain-containing protein, partial [Flavobacteriales bacterium]
KITHFMDSGGDVFIAGSNIGPAQSSGSATFQDFYANYLGASFVSTGDDVGYVLDPVNSDPVFGNSDYKDTLRTDWYTLSADWLSANGQNAAPFISYGEESSTYGAIRNEIPAKGCKSCYLGWAFHTTYNLPSKKNILAMCIDWFDGYWAIGMDEAGGELTGEVYPNPASDFAICEFKAASEPMQLALTDVFGRQVYAQGILPGQDIARMDVSGLANGMYFCKFSGPGHPGDHVVRLLIAH